MRVGRFTPETARWVVERIKWLESQQFYPVNALVDEIVTALTASGDPFAIPVKNDSGEEIPPYACMQVTGTEQYTPETIVLEDQSESKTSNQMFYLKVDKPADSWGRSGTYVFNGATAIESAKYGSGYSINYATAYGPVLSGAETLVPGDHMTPKVDAWNLTKDASGWLEVAGSDNVRDDTYRVFISPTFTGMAWFETPVGGIPAASGGTLGKATCDLYEIEIDGSDNATYAAATDEDGNTVTHTVRNSSGGAVAANAKIQAVLIDGVWVANWEDCS